MQLTTSYLLSGAVLGLAIVTPATGICTGKKLAIGTTALVGTNVQVKVYNTACGVYDTYTQPSTISLCDSSRFYCQQGTVMFEQYDDPVTGWAYNCTADAVRETCGSDTVTRCCFPFWGLGVSDSNPLNH